MENTEFRAMIVEESADGSYVRHIKRKTIDDLPDGDVLIKVKYSSLNYKDALSATGNKGVTRNFPHTPGIDAAGVVSWSRTSAFQPGDEVIVTSYDLGMNTSGGFGQYIRVPADWVVPLPAGLTLKESMIYGTAGFTAGLSVLALRDHDVVPDQGDILVTGATGGVGSTAVAILAKCGYPVVAVSGKPEAEPFLHHLGAREVISREDAVPASKRPLLKSRWAGVIDTVGGDILAAALKATCEHGSVACCGLVASPNLPTTVFPFILRGINLLGIDSQNCPMRRRIRTWELLAKDWKIDTLDELTTEVTLKELGQHIDMILSGQVKGRVVVNLDT